MSNTSTPGTNLFPGAKQAKVYDKGTWLNPGNYEVRVIKGVKKDKVFSTGAPAFILEFKIEKSSRPASIPRDPAESAKEYEDRLAKAPNEVGTAASWFQNLKNEQVGYGALVGFAAKILGENPEGAEFLEGVEDFLNELVKGEKVNGQYVPNAPSAIAGWLLPLEVHLINTKKSPAPAPPSFSLYTFGQRIAEAG